MDNQTALPRQLGQETNNPASGRLQVYIPR